VLALALAVLAGCANSTPTGPFPPRPADIDTNTVDLCTALTAAQRDELGVGPGEAWTKQLSEGPTRICGWSNFDDGFNYTVQTVPGTAGAAVGVPGSTLSPVDGFGAVRVTDYEGSMPLCELYLDTSDDSALRVQAQATARDDDGHRVDSEQVCDRAVTISSHVLRNFQDSAG